MIEIFCQNWYFPAHVCSWLSHIHAAILLLTIISFVGKYKIKSIPQSPKRTRRFIFIPYIHPIMSLGWIYSFNMYFAVVRYIAALYLIANNNRVDPRKTNSFCTSLSRYFQEELEVALFDSTFMMTSWYKNAFYIRFPPAQFPLTEGHYCGYLMFSLLLSRTSCWNVRVAGDMRRLYARVSSRCLKYLFLFVGTEKGGLSQIDRLCGSDPF